MASEEAALADANLREIARLRSEGAALRRWLRASTEAWQDEHATSRALASALRGLLDAPHGCPMCDAGTLRNPAREHWPECPYAIARTVLQNTEQGEL